MNTYTKRKTATPSKSTPAPLDRGFGPIEARVLELEYTIDAPWFSDPRFPAAGFSADGFSADWSRRWSQEPATQPIREELQNLWQQQHGLKPCRMFSMETLASPDRGPGHKSSSRRDYGGHWPGAWCFDHMQFFTDADTGHSAAVLVEPYHFAPATYEAARPALEAAGLGFARHGTSTGFYDPLRCSAMLVVRLDDARHGCLNIPELADALAEQQISARLLLATVGKEYLYRTSDAGRQAHMRSVETAWQLSRPLHPHGGIV